MSEPTRNERIRALRHARGWTQQQAADAVADAVAMQTGRGRPTGIDAQWIGRLERGETRWPNANYRAALRAAYCASTDAELGLAGARQRPEDTPTHLEPAAITPPAERTSEPWHLMDALTRSNISAVTLGQMQRAAFASAARYPSTPPQHLLPLVLDQLNRLRTALLNSQSLRTMRQCVQLTGVLAGLAGNLYLDIGDPITAESYFEIGQTAGHEADDDTLTAWVLTTQSIGPFYSGRFDEAIGLLERAAQLIAPTGNHRRSAWINAMTARAYAARGYRSRALVSLDRAAVQLADADDPKDIDFFDQARLDGMTGSCHLWLKNAQEAETMLRAALNGRASSDAKGRALLVFDLAQCRIVQGEVEEASELASHALTLASGAVVRPIAERAMVLQNELSPWHGLGPVVEYTDRVRDLSASVPEQRGRTIALDQPRATPGL